MYTTENFKSAAALRRAVAEGKRVTYFQPGPFGGREPKDGTFVIEGPHYPEPHNFYVKVKAENGVIVKVFR